MAETSFLEHSGISDWHCLSNTYKKKVCSFAQMQDSMVLSRFPFPTYVLFTSSALHAQPLTQLSLFTRTSSSTLLLPRFPLFGMHFSFISTFPPKFHPFFKVHLFKYFLPQELLVQILIACGLNYMTTFQGPSNLQSLTVSTHLLTPLLDYLDLTLFEYIRAAFPIFSLCVVCC